MKYLIYISFLFLPLMAVSQFQPIQNADWNLWYRNEFKCDFGNHEIFPKNPKHVILK